MSLSRLCKSLVSFALLPFYTVSIPTITGADADAVERPQAIPALREWTDGSGSYTFNAQSRIVLESTGAVQLRETADIFAEDLLQLTGLHIPVVTAENPQAGDIVLRLHDTGMTPGNEGYSLDVTEFMTITAQSDHGVFYGTRTILQLLKQGYTIKGGTARDWSDYPERGLMIDMGRKYFTVPWLESHIRDLAYLKYNYFHLHLSDNFGFRLESESHPEIVSPQHYTKAEIRALIALASKYHITVVPEIDMPGHMDTILASHPELCLTSATGKQRTGDIDLSKAESYTLMKDLLEEYIPLFSGPYWHIGADEYLMHDDYANYPQLLAYAQAHYGPEAIAKDTYLGFVNWTNEIVKAHGKTTRAWNDGLYGGKAVTVADDIVYEHWYGHGLTPQEIVDLGLYIMNGNADYLYYVLGHDWHTKPDLIYETFETHIFHDKAHISPLHQKHLGAKLHVWCDRPDAETEQQVAAGIEESLRALAQKNWGSTKPATDYAAFAPIINLIGRAPGYNIVSDSQPVDGAITLSVSESLASTEEDAC